MPCFLMNVILCNIIVTFFEKMLKQFEKWKNECCDNMSCDPFVFITPVNALVILLSEPEEATGEMHCLLLIKSQ